MAEPRPHDHGKGHCTSCGPLSKCPTCKKATLHRVGTEYVCESHFCSPDARISEAFKAEMAERLKTVK